MEETLCKSVAAVGFKNRGVKRGDFAVIRAAKDAGVSSALLEVCFLDDADDMKVYAAKFQNIVKAIAAGLRDGFGLTDNSARGRVQQKAGLEESTMDYLENYRYGDELLNKLAGAMD